MSKEPLSIFRPLLLLFIGRIQLFLIDISIIYCSNIDMSGAAGTDDNLATHMLEIQVESWSYAKFHFYTVNGLHYVKFLCKIKGP